MAELTPRSGIVCRSVLSFMAVFPSSDGQTAYTVTYGPYEDPFKHEEEYGWECTCRGYQTRKGRPGFECKHIKQAKKKRCGWYEVFVPQKNTHKGSRLCPRCQGSTEKRVFLVLEGERRLEDVDALLDALGVEAGPSVFHRVRALAEKRGASPASDAFARAKIQRCRSDLDEVLRSFYLEGDV